MSLATFGPAPGGIAFPPACVLAKPGFPFLFPRVISAVFITSPHARV